MSVTQTADLVRPKLEAARQELLDLGLRNALISFRPLKARGVEVFEEVPDAVYRLLVGDGKRMTFKPARVVPVPALAQPELPTGADVIQPEGPAYSAWESWPPTPEDTARQQGDTQLQTQETNEKLQARLLQTFYSARTFIEEQGVNILYLALGMLVWYEDDSSASETPRRAPLVLVPVELERTNALDHFHLKYTGEEIGENLSLRAKLHGEFGIVIPEFPEAEDFDITAYFASVTAAVATRTRWAVDPSAIALGFFSFGKFLMYRDLDDMTWPEGARPGEHPLIQALLTPDGFNEAPSAISDDAFLDPYITPGDVHQVVDADSSQTLAILDVNAGRNLVIQGPPGTGKSQTITNIIAEAIGAGKTVLFVAEKMAALEVVKRRLDSVGLGDACLELHSHKINKRSVLQELARTLELGKPRVSEMAGELALLEDHRDRLNAYAHAVNTPIGESGVTPYEAYGDLIRLRALPDSSAWPRFEMFALATWGEVEYARRREIVSELQQRLVKMGVPPVEHPFWGSRKAILLPSDIDRLRAELTQCRTAFDTLRDASATLDGLPGFVPATRGSGARQSVAAARRILSAPDLTGVDIAANEWVTNASDLTPVLDAGRAYAELRATHDATVIPEAWQQDLLPIRHDLAAFRDTWWRVMSGRYRAAKSSLARFCKAGLPDGLDTQIALLDDLAEARRKRDIILEHTSLGTRLFGSGWQAESSDWPRLTMQAEWLTTLHADIASGTLPVGILTALSTARTSDGLALVADAVEHAASAWVQRAQAVGTLLDFDDARRFGAESTLAEQPFATLDDLLRTWAARTDDLDEMVAVNMSAQLCRKEGLAEVSDVAEHWTGAARDLVHAFERERATVLLEHAVTGRPPLAGFDTSAHEHVIDRFRELDQAVFRYNRSRLAAQHWSRLPQHEAGGQLGVLRREMAKKTRHLAIRRLIDQAGVAIQAIKPVFMMSPLSIATYVPPGTLRFDLVIFDEASQVKPVDAFGALVRGRQAVVVGDSRQLPPTSFFDSLVGSDEVDEDDVTSDLESILGLFSAQSAPSRMLRWHYRSRHESLIAVSNHEFYENRLIVFPSPDAGRHELGLVYHHLTDTAYERGTSRTNPAEALAVAEAVMQHARRSPELTLGVASFSVAQTGAIRNQLEVLRRNDPSNEAYFAAHPHEPFFVKNLENVQGDERDVIYISVGYGRTAEGYLAMNFGPLNSEGGERRLNVLITRARLRCEVFTNLTSDDIDLARTQARGVVSLKRFLKYAQTGILDVPRESGHEAGSPFEEEVQRTLELAGYTVQGQIGSAGFFIDLAVVDPRRPGRYLLGIECDGASYHSARSARDRDRLRQQVLEGLGWTIHRIWSTDWFRNPDREMQRLVSAIEQALAAGGGNSAPPPAPSPPTPQDTERGDADDGSWAPYPAALPPYVVARPRIVVQGELHLAPASDLQRWVTEVVTVESPVHADEVARRITDAAGVGRIGSRIRAAIDSAIVAASLSGSIEQRGPFLWASGMIDPPLRDRSVLPQPNRSLTLVAPEEIAAAIRKAVSDAYGLAPSDVSPAAARLLGFGRVTDDVRNVVEPLVQALVESGELRQQGGVLTVM